MSMADKMKQKAIPATSVKRSKKILKSVKRADVIELNQTMQLIIEQNRRELRESWETEHDKIVGC